MSTTSVHAQESPPAAPAETASSAGESKAAPAAQPPLIPLGDPKPIEITKPVGTFDERMDMKITLDVRDMSVIDVIRFLALKGDFNIVTASSVQGRATFYLKSVSIRDALNIACLSNRLAYIVQNEIIQVMTEQDYQLLFGKSFSDKKIVEIVHLDYAKPSYVLAALDGIKSQIGQIIIDEDTGNVVLIDTPKSVEAMKAALQKIERPLEVIVYPLQYAKADVVAEQLRARVDANSVGSISIDERTNKMVVRAYPGRRAEVEKIIKELDAVTREVMVEARVLQVVFNPKFDFGIDWNSDFRNSGHTDLRKLSFNNVFMDEDSLSSSSNLASTFTKIGYGNFSVDEFQLAIRALKQVSDTKILSNPKLLVTNNQEAKIHVGDTVPYIVSTTSGTGDNAITSEDVRFVDVGLKLNVTPTINEEGYVTMVLNPEISTVTQLVTSQGGGIPQVNKTEVETTVMVKNGETVVLGGLKKENKTLSRKGFPVLMDIPLIRRLFSSTAEAIESTEIVIFITPHIVTGDKGALDFEGHLKPVLDYTEKDKKSLEQQKEQVLRLKN